LRRALAGPFHVHSQLEELLSRSVCLSAVCDTRQRCLKLATSSGVKSNSVSMALWRQTPRGSARNFSGFLHSPDSANDQELSETLEGRLGHPAGGPVLPRSPRRLSRIPIPFISGSAELQTSRLNDAFHQPEAVFSSLVRSDSLPTFSRVPSLNTEGAFLLGFGQQSRSVPWELQSRTCRRTCRNMSKKYHLFSSGCDTMASTVSLATLGKLFSFNHLVLVSRAGLEPKQALDRIQLADSSIRTTGRTLKIDQVTIVSPRN